MSGTEQICLGDLTVIGVTLNFQEMRFILLIHSAAKERGTNITRHVDMNECKVIGIYYSAGMNGHVYSPVTRPSESWTIRVAFAMFSKRLRLRLQYKMSITQCNRHKDVLQLGYSCTYLV